MTHNPTQADVQAAYDRLRDFSNGRGVFSDDFDLPCDAIATLLAAVARDTLGWRGVIWGEWHDCGEHARFESNVGPDRQDRYWIKDAPNADPS